MKQIIKISSGLLLANMVAQKFPSSLNISKNTSTGLGIASVAMPIYSAKYVLKQFDKL